MSVYSIGQYPFLNMTPIPGIVAQSVAIESAVGQDGVDIWLTGKRGKPFQTTTIVDTPGIVAAAVLLELYKRLQDDVPQPIVWADIAIANLLYKVLRVEASGRGAIAIAGGRGGLETNPGGLVEATWDLLPIEF